MSGAGKDFPSPYSLEQPAEYAAWRERKLAAAPTSFAELLVEVDDPRRLSEAERNAILERVQRANMAIYASNSAGEADPEIARRVGAQLGLVSLDKHYLADDEGISALTVAEGNTHAEFIPYTDRAIRWHTDGYYNPPERSVRGMLLHCVRPAARGGDNRLLDHEIAYILLRDRDPEFVRALSAPDAMTIPARQEVNGADGANGEARPAQGGPVFSVDEHGHLHMRYTARRISILWKEEAAAAAMALEEILSAGTAWTLRGRLEAGMGLVCNNVLHDRSAFQDDEARRRLLYRARYHERVGAGG